MSWLLELRLFIVKNVLILLIVWLVVVIVLMGVRSVERGCPCNLESVFLAVEMGFILQVVEYVSLAM